MAYLIHDKVDNDYHTGNGEWSHDRERALRYPTLEEAKEGLDDVDEEEIMRDRLHIIVEEETI